MNQRRLMVFLFFGMNIAKDLCVMVILSTAPFSLIRVTLITDTRFVE